MKVQCNKCKQWKYPKPYKHYTRLECENDKCIYGGNKYDHVMHEPEEGDFCALYIDTENKNKYMVLVNHDKIHADSSFYLICKLGNNVWSYKKELKDSFVLIDSLFEIKF